MSRSPSIRRHLPAMSFLAAAVLAVPAMAQSVERALQDCLELGDAAARLACFEQVARRHVDTSAALPPDDRTTVSRADRAAPDETPAPATLSSPADRFGLPPERVPELQEGRRDMVIAEARRASRGEWILAMENGQVWRQTDRSRLPEIRPGAVAHVEQGPLGGFIITVARRSLRAKRVE